MHEGAKAEALSYKGDYPRVQRRKGTEELADALPGKGG